MKRAKKLEGNGMWESSRMMLPEHKETIVRHRKELGRKSKPLLDEQRMEELSRKINESVEMKSIVWITLFHPLKEEIVTGQITAVNAMEHKIKVIKPDHTQIWIPISNILDVENLI